ncbi:MAG: cobyrinic acid a,c-diamide synthase [Beggiatoa sp. IS2]|nr:MAG: cobyrinic acid a,c-diamide synthase [Beggiatoa sp. IS2]
MSRILISAAHKSSGKTIITLGLCAALATRHLKVQPFKKGPDYIDPLWLSQAAQRPCHNLDFYTMTTEEIRRTVAYYSQDADITMIEGNKGLHDGLDLTGSNSNAALAKLLDTPVILVIDTQGITRGIAPLLLGYQDFDKTVRLAGVILNKVGGKRHEGKLRAAVEHYTTIPVLGAIPTDERLHIVERHLGLMPSNEECQADRKIAEIATVIAESVDIDLLLTLAQQAPALSNQMTMPSSPAPDVTIGIIRDAAFGFYYPGDLLALQAAGAQLVFIDALRDTRLPRIDGLFIGGGFPEVQMMLLEKNQLLRTAIRGAIEQELPVYAECGGLMYLARRLIWHGQTCEMVGVLPCDIVMEKQPQGRGYVHLRETGQGLWPLRTADGQLGEFHAHEFHYSRVVRLPSNISFAYQVLRGTGLNGHYDGWVYKNTLACYVHLRDVENNHWTQRFVEFVRTHSRTRSFLT